MTSGAGLAFNGKFLTAKPTGVHRVALELLKAIDREVTAGSGSGSENGADGTAVPAMRVITPSVGAALPPLRSIAVTPRGRLGGQVWEQIELPRLAGQDLIVSLCNIGPVWSRRAVTIIHDAQVYLTPASYSAAFKLKYRLMLPMIGRHHQRIVTVSAYSREQLALHGVAPRERISIVHNGVDHILAVAPEAGIVAQLGLEIGGFVLALANTQEHKNIGLLFRAFASPLLRELTLVLVGIADRAAFAAAGHYAPPNVCFAGAVSDGALRGLMEAALCLAFPSRTEGFGLPPLEAMLVGCPSVVAPCGALPEVCGDAVLYCDPDDPDAWRDTIARLKSAPGERAALVKQGVEHAQKYTWQAAGQRLLSILRQEIAAARYLTRELSG